MEGRTYNGSNIDECLDRASEELGIPREKLTYVVTEEKRGFFKKSISILVNVEDEKKKELKNGTVKVQDGVIVVKNPEEGGRPAVINPSSEMKLLVDCEEVKTRREVYEMNLIEVHFEEIEAKRFMNISVSEDKIKAYISIKYIPQTIFCLKDTEEMNYVTLERVKKEEIFPPVFTVEDIKEELRKLGICRGIIEENLIKCTEKRGVSELLIASATPVVDDEDDKLDIKFNVAKNPLESLEDSVAKVDFRNLCSIDTVCKGDLIAIKITGQVGTDGVDVYGNVLKKKDKKKIDLRIGGGCLLQDENTVVAAISGKPCIKNNTFYVYQVHEVMNDVDLKSGNIHFIGDVIVYGGVKEGMKVEAGNNIEIQRDVEHADILAKGNINIKGNVINSNVASGGEDIIIQRLIANLLELKTTLKGMTDAVIEIKKFNLLGTKITDGEIIKVLIENKFKTIPKLGISIIRDTVFKSSNGQDKVVTLIKQKLMGMAPLNIYHFSELDEMGDIISERINELEGKLSLPVNIQIAYCQDSNITSSGDIYITGKGEYVSQITANNGVYFLDDRAVTRGGIIKARNVIKCRKVGSTGGVSTRLCVEQNGHIWADVAFQNTIFIIGLKEYIIEKPSKNIHAYIDQNGDIAVDKLYL